MIGRLTLALGLLLTALLFYETVWADGWHSDGACYGQSYDNKTALDQFWWKSASTCSDHPAWQLGLDVHIQYFNWNTWNWQDWTIYPNYGEGPMNVSFTAESRYRTVAPYGGAACWRIRGIHTAIELPKGMYWQDMSYSWGECY